MEQDYDTNQETAEINKRYKALVKSSKSKSKSADQLIIRKAFDMALEAHSGTRRKSGEPYIYHPIEVAQIVVDEIGLSTTSIVCALLHDVVEDTDVTLDDIDGIFGGTVARIIDGLTKISQVFDQTSSIQAENFRKMLLTLSDDVRVILIKLADRLHNMRTLGSMPAHKKRKIASETLFLYAPLAHRLGLYSIKSDLEDLGLKYTEPIVYDTIEGKLKKTKAVRTRFVNQFTLPIKRNLDNVGITYDVKGRTKSIFSIWNKMQKKGIPFEEVYDVFAIRVVITSKENEEKADCWKAYSMVTDFYTPNPDRLRDWISTPKANGYESLHTTVMSPTGKWVEVQIRTKRMDDIAEKGFAAHWKYKGSGIESSLDGWIRRIREMLENPDIDAVDFVDDFKLNLFTKEIFIFTPKGDLITLPARSTTLDFAFEIHTQVGEKCIGARVNFKLVPLSYELKSGDQVDIITSNKQKVKEDWLKFVITAKAKSKIKTLLKEEKRAHANEGETIFLRKLKSYKIQLSEDNQTGIIAFYKQQNQLDFYFAIAKGLIDLSKLKKIAQENGILQFDKPVKSETSLKQLVTNVRGKADMLVLGENMDDIDYKLSPCCSPIPGDDVFGFITINEGIKIHRVTCPNAMQLMANYAYRIVQAKWTSQESISFLAGLVIKGIDDMGLVNEITRVISNQSKINMQSISFESVDGIFEGKIMLFVQDTEHLHTLTNKLKIIKGVYSIERIDSK
jgi:GTP diphosphokinase / guanosine-3',5'-bis(diphosphate) 3'-diphosphatase